MDKKTIKVNVPLKAGVEYNLGEVLSDNARRWRELQKHLATSPVRDVTFNSPATIDRWAINFKNENGELETAWVDQPLVAGKNYSMDDLLNIAMKYTAIEQYNSWAEEMNRKISKRNENQMHQEDFVHPNCCGKAMHSELIESHLCATKWAKVQAELLADPPAQKPARKPWRKIFG